MIDIKDWKVPTWEELFSVVRTGKTESYLETIPSKIKPVMALALSVAKWHPDSNTPHHYLGKWDSCGLCLMYIDNKCSGCPLSKAGENCTESYGSAFTLWRRDEDNIQLKYDMYNLLASLYKQAYNAYPKKPRYKNNRINDAK